MGRPVDRVILDQIQTAIASLPPEARVPIEQTAQHIRDLISTEVGKLALSLVMAEAACKPGMQMEEREQLAARMRDPKD